MLENLISEAFLVIVVVSGVPLAMSAVAALLVSVVQAATQIQEQSIGHLIKFAVVSVVFLVLGGTFVRLILRFFTESLEAVGFLSW